MTTYVYRDGARLTPYMLYLIDKLDEEFHKEFGLHIKVTSGIRTPEEQEAIFRSRYTLTPNGRRVYDTRWWNGQLWYRISPAGTVAIPRTSNHEIQGNRAAVDLADTGTDAGVTVIGSVRSNWLRANASRFGLVATGFSFGEAWHYDVLNIFAAVPSGGGSNTAKETTVIHYHREDATSRKTGRTLEATDQFWLHTTAGVATSQASNIVGGIGNYTLIAHLYATGTPGNALEVVLAWGRGRAESYHYVERLVFDKDGIINANVPFIRPVTKGYSVFARCRAVESNTGSSRVTVFDTDTLLVV